MNMARRTGEMVYLSAREKAILRQLAEEHGYSKSEWVRQMIIRAEQTLRRTAHTQAPAPN